MNKQNLSKFLDPKHKEGKNFENIKNFGFQEPEINPEDYIFLGASKIPDEIIKSDGQWLDIVIEKEWQAKNGVETFNCTSFGTASALEIINKFKYQKENNWSDRALGIMAGNTPSGNSPQNPAEAIRKNGVINEALLPFDDIIKNWQQYHSPKPLPQNLLDKGQEWLKECIFLHEWVPTTMENLKAGLKRSPLGISVKAWKMRNGLYYKEKGETDNHWVVLIGYEEKKYWYIFDSYDAWIKKLEWNYDFGFAKRYYLKKNQEETLPINEKKNMTTTPSDGYLKSDLEKIKLPAGSEISEEDMFSNWIPWNFIVETKAEDLSFIELLKAIISKLFGKK